MKRNMLTGTALIAASRKWSEPRRAFLVMLKMNLFAHSADRSVERIAAQRPVLPKR